MQRAGTSMLCYLAGPIDDVAEPEATGWRSAARTSLSNRGIFTYDPVLAFMAEIDRDRDVQTAATIVEINKSVISKVDIVLVNLLGPGRAFGTIREIEFAKTEGLPVVVACNNLISLAAYDVSIVDTLKEAIEYIIEYSEQYD